jgi:hypothetical protein
MVILEFFGLHFDCQKMIKVVKWHRYRLLFSLFSNFSSFRIRTMSFLSVTIPRCNINNNKTSLLKKKTQGEVTKFSQRLFLDILNV